MLQESRAVSILDLENLLDTVDKSTIFRTITLFLSHHLIHSIDDGSGALKYAVCGNSCSCSVEDLHSHFYCNVCHKTYCLEGIDVPIVKLPIGFSLYEAIIFHITYFDSNTVDYSILYRSTPSP